jgi:hypothetical protein
MQSVSCSTNAERIAYIKFILLQSFIPLRFLCVLSYTASIAFVAPLYGALSLYAIRTIALTIVHFDGTPS